MLNVPVGKLNHQDKVVQKDQHKTNIVMVVPDSNSPPFSVFNLRSRFQSYCAMETGKKGCKVFLLPDGCAMVVYRTEQEAVNAVKYERHYKVHLGEKVFFVFSAY